MDSACSTELGSHYRAAQANDVSGNWSAFATPSNAAFETADWLNYSVTMASAGSTSYAYIQRSVASCAACSIVVACVRYQ